MKISANFTSQIKIDFLEELTKVRLRKVAELLTDSSNSMSSIATECGFSSANYMTELFKREYGLSPREYRKGLK